MSTATNNEPPLLVALHFLGGSADQWTPMFEALADDFRCVAIDLPGFGAAAGTPGYDVAAMAAHVAAKVRPLAPSRWLIVGHSMGAKVACAVARLAEDGADGLQGLTHLVLVAGSPPRPEPMGDAKRQIMQGWFTGGDAERRQQADGYIRDNVEHDLPPERHAAVVGAVLRSNRTAWRAWLDGGSREDWTARIGTLNTPTLILAGDADAALGMEVQRTVMAPHFASARYRTLPRTGHLLPIEQPEAVAACITDFVTGSEPGEPPVPAEYRALIDSHRVSERTRRVLLERAQPVALVTGAIPVDQIITLRALLGRLIPQGGERPIDLAARLIGQVAAGAEDGWRFAELPPDMQALRSGLDTLDLIAKSFDAPGFAQLRDDQQDALLTALADGELAPIPTLGARGLTSPQLRSWFEDVRSFAVQIYASHPATAARIGYSGVGNRGDGAGPQGFQQVGIDQRESWEPVPDRGADR